MAGELRRCRRGARRQRAALLAGALAGAVAVLRAPTFVAHPGRCWKPPAAAALLPAGALGASPAWGRGLSEEQELKFLEEFRPGENGNVIDFSLDGSGEEITATYVQVVDDERLSQGISATVEGAFDALGKGDVLTFLSIILDYVAEIGDNLSNASEDGEFPWQLVGTVFIGAVLFANMFAALGPILSQLFEPSEDEAKPVPEEVMRRFNELKEERRAKEEEAKSLDLTLPEGRAVREIDAVKPEEFSEQGPKKQKVIKTTMLSGDVVEEKVWEVTGDPIATEQGKPKTWKSA